MKLMLNWDKKDYRTAKDQAFILQHDIVKPEDAGDWIKNNLVGGIIKD